MATQGIETSAAHFIAAAQRAAVLGFVLCLATPADVVPSGVSAEGTSVVAGPIAGFGSVQLGPEHLVKGAGAAWSKQRAASVRQNWDDNAARVASGLCHTSGRREAAWAACDQVLCVKMKSIQPLQGDSSPRATFFVADTPACIFNTESEGLPIEARIEVFWGDPHTSERKNLNLDPPLRHSERRTVGLASFKEEGGMENSVVGITAFLATRIMRVVTRKVLVLDAMCYSLVTPCLAYEQSNALEEAVECLLRALRTDNLPLEGRRLISNRAAVLNETMSMLPGASFKLPQPNQAIRASLGTNGVACLSFVPSLEIENTEPWVKISSQHEAVPRVLRLTDEPLLGEQRPKWQAAKDQRTSVATCLQPGSYRAELMYEMAELQTPLIAPKASVDFYVYAHVVLGLHIGGHDPSLAVVADGRLIVHVEFERVTGRRYGWQTSPLSDARSIEMARTVLRQALQAVDSVFAMVAQHFDVAVLSHESSLEKLMPASLQDIISATLWEVADHHQSHALYGFWDSRFVSAKIFSFDGSGNDGNFNVFDGNRASDGIDVRMVDQVIAAHGLFYQYLPLWLDPFSRRRPEKMIRDGSECPVSWQPTQGGILSVPGSAMAFAGLGVPQERWKAPLMRILMGHGNSYVTNECGAMWSDFPDVEELPFRGQQAKDMMATMQSVFEESVVDIVLHFIGAEDNVVLSGGCALNVKTNEAVRRLVGSSRVWVPAAPNDAGLSIGLALNYASVGDVTVERASVYLGLPISDIQLLPQLAQQYNAQQVGLVDVAKLLLDRKAVATVRGRQEIGPRALGHRSFLCLPGDEDVKQKFNNIKARQWWRPVAPIVIIEHVKLIFEVDEHATTFVSPFMSFGPQVKPYLGNSTMQSITHVDGSSRVQTVMQGSEAWLHALLSEVAEHTGFGVLMNTSFNLRDEAMVNTVVRALEILSSATALDFVLIEDFLFSRSS